MILGAHVSVAGGVSKAFERAREVTAQCMQIFTRNQRRWAARPLADEEIASFRQQRQATGIGPNMAHASYLVNLGSPDPELAQKSIAALTDEALRCDQLGIEYLVFHPGSSPDGVETGLARVAERLDRIVEARGDDSAVTILLENTAGQGNTLGLEFAHLRDVMAASRYPERLGICFDTCHAFAAGHAWHDADSYAAVMGDLVEKVSLDKLLAFHLNDSLRPFGTRKDRHAGIGEGEIGLAPFGPLLNDPRFADRPGTLETPEAEKAYKRELAMLRSLLA